MQPRETRFDTAKRDAAGILTERQRVDGLILQKEQEVRDVEARIEQDRRSSARELASRAIAGEPTDGASRQQARVLRDRLEDLNEEILALKSHRAESDDRVLAIGREYSEALHEESSRILEPMHQKFLAADRVRLAAQRELVGMMLALGQATFGPQNVRTIDPLTGDDLGSVVVDRVSNGTWLTEVPTEPSSQGAVNELAELKYLGDAVGRQAREIESQRRQAAAAAVRKRAS